jgi:hypothetical protein
MKNRVVASSALGVVLILLDLLQAAQFRASLAVDKVEAA